MSPEPLVRSQSEPIRSVSILGVVPSESIEPLRSLFFCLMQVRAEYLGRSIVIRRLRRQQLLACVFFILTAVCMSMQTLRYGPCRRNEWMVALAIACALELYTAWRIPAELQKVKKS